MRVTAVYLAERQARSVRDDQRLTPRRGHPPDHTPRRASTRAGWRREIMVVAAIYVVYDAIRLLPGVRLHAADGDGSRVLALEHRLHWAPEHALNVGLHALPTPVPVAAAYFYESLHYLVTPIVLVWLYRTARADYPRARTALAAMTLSALTVFWLFPVTPPRMLPGARLTDIVAEEHRYGWWSGGGTAPRGLGSFVNEYAAMPSLHVGWALWCGVQLYRHARRPAVRALGVLYPVLTAIVVMATGNHYLLDALAGAVVALLGWAMAIGLERVRDVIRAAPSSAPGAARPVRDPAPGPAQTGSRCAGRPRAAGRGPGRRPVRAVVAPPDRHPPRPRRCSP
jgi:hypothetical protein